MFASVKDSNPIVMTTHGKIIGENRRGVAVFRGIPYGGNCDGKRRFQAPVPASDWEGIRDCTKNGPVAMQLTGSISTESNSLGKYFSGSRPEELGIKDEVMSENCLVLNVLTPGLDERKRPVVVYIHGGGFMSGSGSLTLGADLWADEEDIVIVGINHRINAFGALYLGDFDPKYRDSGAAGMLDCVLALEWVRDNIKSFGGDPANVTIMGESGGGQKVNTLLTMESARGLFNKAIVESGSGAPGAVTKEMAVQEAKKLLAALEIPTDQLDRLLEIPAEDIVQAILKSGTGYSPVGDDIWIPCNPEGKYPEIDPWLPLLVGSSEEEMAVFAPAPEDLSWEGLREMMLKMASSEDGGPFAANLSVTEENIDDVLLQMKEHGKPGITPRHIFFQAVSMGTLLCAGALRQAIEKAEKGAGHVYHYFVTYDAPFPGNPEKQHYSWHTADLPLQMRVVQFPECEEISKLMAHSWAAFIRTGNPSTEELDWPPFTVQSRETMVIDNDTHIEYDPTKFYRDIL